jgi:menaquinone-dependent protoporphyrinogen IX oxidase
MKQTLIVYGTRRGTTEKTAQVIGEMLVLKFSHNVEMVNVNSIRKYRKRLHAFDNLIIGSSIVRGRWVFRARWFLKRYDFSKQKVAVFVTAGFTMNKAIELGVPKVNVLKEAIEKYIDKYVENTSVKPVSKMAFGGMIVRSRREKFNSWNREDIESWVMQLGKLLD